MTTKTFEEKLKRAWEVNVYNDLGFYIIGSSLEETDKGYKSEKRDCTDRELDFWERCVLATPEIPVIPIMNKIINVDDYFCKNNENINCHDVVWVENDKIKILLKKEEGFWEIKHRSFKF